MAERLICCAAHTKLLLPALSLPAVRTRCDLCCLCGLKNKLWLALASVLQDASYPARARAAVDALSATLLARKARYSLVLQPCDRCEILVALG